MDFITGGVAGKLVDLGSQIIDKVFPDKIAQESERAKAQLALLSLQQSGELDLLTTQISAILAEAQSADPWTSRARPTFLYVMYVMIISSLLMGILSAFYPEIPPRIAEGMRAWLAAIPDSLYTLFGVGYLGYTGARTWEKNKGVTK